VIIVLFKKSLKRPKEVWLGLWCLTPLSTIFQLYRRGQLVYACLMLCSVNRCLSFYFRPLYCLSVFDLRLLITHVVSGTVVVVIAWWLDLQLPVQSVPEKNKKQTNITTSEQFQNLTDKWWKQEKSHIYDCSVSLLVTGTSNKSAWYLGPSWSWSHGG
jgi:hypothetical protein